MDYLRVPVTDEKAPKPSDFQLLIQVGAAPCCACNVAIRCRSEAAEHVVPANQPASSPAPPCSVIHRPPTRPPPCCLQRCWDPPPGAALVFNCQMGRGRTTTGMVIASLLHLRRAVRRAMRLAMCRAVRLSECKAVCRAVRSAARRAVQQGEAK